MKAGIATLALLVPLSLVHADAPQTGKIAVYGNQSRGVPTASGELYEPNALTAAHSSLPLGTFVRVAHFETGRMVDVRINDRKPTDGYLLYLSSAAAQQVGFPVDRPSEGSLLVLNTGPAAGALPVTTTAASPNQPFRPFAEWKQREAMKKAVQRPEVAASGAVAATSGGGPFSNLGKKMGNNPFSGLFKKNTAPASSYPTTSGYAPNEVTPMSSTNVAYPSAAYPSIPAPEQPVPAISAPVARQTNPISPVVAAPSPPYLVQFGSFRDAANAQQLNGQLSREGLGTVVQPTSTGWYRVVTGTGFQSSEQASGWINYEASRRGWRSLPVVTR